jgi:predicted Fe-S protein YdhL (DUF1289 family)
MQNTSSPESPCRRQCILVIDPHWGAICTGCFRTQTEIAEWSSVNLNRKKEIIDNVVMRRESSNSRDN